MSGKILRDIRALWNFVMLLALENFNFLLLEIYKKQNFSQGAAIHTEVSISMDSASNGLKPRSFRFVVFVSGSYHIPCQQSVWVWIWEGGIYLYIPGKQGICQFRLQELWPWAILSIELNTKITLMSKNEIFQRQQSVEHLVSTYNFVSFSLEPRMALSRRLNFAPPLFFQSKQARIHFCLRFTWKQLSQTKRGFDPSFVILPRRWKSSRKREI